jgi:uncharacterized membrane protein
MLKEKYTLFLLFGILAALGKEQVWVTVSMMGLYIAFVKKSPKVGIPISIISGTVFYLLFWVAIPAVTPAQQHFALSYLSEFGEGLNDIVKNILTNPFMILSVLLRPDRLYYYYQLLFPLGLLPLLSPLPLLFSMESFLINTLSNNDLLRQIDYQYNCTIVPFLMIAAIQGYAVLQKMMGNQSKKSSAMIIGWVSVCMVIGLYMWGEFPVGKSQWFWHFITPVAERQAMQQVADNIDSSQSVSVTNNIGSHFSQRQYLYNFPINADTADYTVVYLGDPYAWPSGDQQTKTVQSLLQNPGYSLISQQGNFFAFKKK